MSTHLLLHPSSQHRVNTGQSESLEHMSDTPVVQVLGRSSTGHTGGSRTVRNEHCSLEIPRNILLPDLTTYANPTLGLLARPITYNETQNLDMGNELSQLLH